MDASDFTPQQRRDLLAGWGLDPWPTLLGSSQAAALEQPAHVDVEATYSPGHFEDANFEGLMIEGARDLGLRDGTRYRVVGLLRPGSPPGGVQCAGYNGPLLYPFEIEAITHAWPVDHEGLAIRAYRSPGWLRDDGRGGHLEPRQSRLDVLVGLSGDALFLAVVRVLSRATEAFAIHRPCRDVWREMFPADDPPSMFDVLECVDPAPPAAVPLPDDPAAAMLALRERLLAGIQRRPNTCGADALLLAVAPGGVFCLRLGDHRVLRRTGSALMPVLWEHNIRRYPPQPPEHEVPEWMQRVRLSTFAPDSSPCFVDSFPLAAGDRWVAVSGGLFEQLADDAVHDALRSGSPDAAAAWLAAEAARLPDGEAHANRREWSLLVIDTPAPEPAHPREAPAALDLNSMLAQLHELERNRR